ncbi:MAG: hypothetical protein KKE02_14190 [Alphaproteobacteria bacterium]|nr:hypothetical protein [Alphaproteobacteria bacterium]MBU1513141.1 hypothetical protein [Alphaproteobacteria bacterium]MBU2095249.1 hypothetical protein [Alphaproteobacteria bacterium]MBU2152164.1 hypothetical protein [Alphaproteobacteria bacterium]MBU2306789.1 hypothetical protein [Alphaproteobacteria bacterium]
MTRMLAAALAVSALTALTAVPTLAAAQASPSAIAKGYKAPRNHWGQPDLAGNWTNATITPFERDAKLGDRLVLSEDEARALEGVNAKLNEDGAQPTDPNLKVTDLPYECGRGFKGVDCGYNNFWVDPGTKIIRMNGEPRSSVIVEPKNGRMPAMTKDAMARLQARMGTARVGNFDGPERRPLGERCIMSFGSSAGPPMLPSLYNNNYSIIQSGDEVMIQIEMVHDSRIIRLNAQHDPSGLRKWMGDSIGRWEGDTLVVETVNMRAEQGLRGAGGETLKVTERFTRISPSQILYQFELNDPATYTAPVKGEVALNATKGPIYEYACHEGNYALPGILAGAREEERKGREMEGNRGEVKEEGAAGE